LSLSDVFDIDTKAVGEPASPVDVDVEGRIRDAYRRLAREKNASVQINTARELARAKGIAHMEVAGWAAGRST
jgi:hypothetical protein